MPEVIYSKAEKVHEKTHSSAMLIHTSDDGIYITMHCAENSNTVHLSHTDALEMCNFISEFLVAAPLTGDHNGHQEGTKTTSVNHRGAR